jgi:Fe-S-cluster containining protein
MPHPTDPSAADPWLAWRDAGRDPRVDQQLRALYDDLAAEIARRAPTCWISGRCCKFETYAHRLYITALEVAWLIDRLDDASLQRLREANLPGMDGCPFQLEGLCSVHATRPLGCRIYFCDPAAQHWQNPVYESFLDRLRALHAQHHIDYRYLEWRAALNEARASWIR